MYIFGNESHSPDEVIWHSTKHLLTMFIMVSHLALMEKRSDKAFIKSQDVKKQQ